MSTPQSARTDSRTTDSSTTDSRTTNSGTTEKSNFTTFKVRCKQIDNFNPSYENFVCS